MSIKIKTKIGYILKIYPKVGNPYYIFQKDCLNCKGHKHTSSDFSFQSPCLKCNCKYFFGWSSMIRKFKKKGIDFILKYF